MTDNNLAPKFDPQAVEAGRYDNWLEQDLFKPSGDKNAAPYSIVIPPPNVTGKLHIGHAWDTTLQDIIIRFKRMQGFDTLYLPGMDHAGIATQAKVEAKLAEDGISRYDLGREKFLDEVWAWKDEYAGSIKQQWGKLGLSLDYSRERFTLDEGLSNAVKKVFVDLYNKGIIYRGKKIINWDPKAQTALSNIEVIHEDINGAFYHINYELEDGSGVVEIATTRPETFLGDTAVIVNPNDERYKNIVGKNVVLPIIGRVIPVLTDEHADMETGTGVVKITPAHDPNDFEVGQRLNLESIDVMNNDGSINENGGKYAGLDRFEARKQIVAELKELGALVKIEEITHQVGHSERTGVVVEPRLSTQWFVKMESLAEKAIANQATDDKVEFYPPRFNDAFLTWMENVHDWVISRQLWWGHQIPAYYNKETGEMIVSENAPKDSENWEQDPDVLDTWFSSALWPFSTMGWPDESAPDYERYFPTSTLVTGYDIMPFWVSRMIFQSLEFTGRRPFDNALIHGLIRAEDGRKMSKSLGNGIDPMDVIDKYGCDALRWFLANGSTPGQDTRFSYEKMDAAWNFINKIWNASRYVLMNLEAAQIVDITSADLNVTDKWILTRLSETIETATANFERFEFGIAGHELYNFIWEDFCNWYLEMSKEVLYGEDEAAKNVTKSVLLHVLDNIVRLLQPIMPFVSDAIYEKLPTSKTSVSIAQYPIAGTKYPESIGQFELLKGIIQSVRNIRVEANAAPSKEVDLYIKASGDALTTLKANANYINRFANPAELVIAEEVNAPEPAMSAVITGAELFMPLAGLINVEEEIARLEKELDKWTKEVVMAQKKLGNEKFVNSAPEKVVAEVKAKEADYLAKQETVKQRIEELKKL
ncbi:MAG: valine--tRNA ligase [Lactobacillales bacterium]|jgi:valyl-tRNA synthetase|nr:valine--tRNA ligase [Lactobacillales bacterium]